MAVSDLQERKLAKRFELLDVDGNGYIERADYEQLVDALLEAYREPADSPVAVRLRDGFLRLWRGLAAVCEVGDGGRVDPVQFRKAVAAGVLNRDGGYERIIQPATDAVLELADTNGDGQVSIDEYIILIGHFGVTGDEAREFADAVDANGDGAITTEEVLAASRDFYLSSDPDAPGNKLFGRF